MSAPDERPGIAPALTPEEWAQRRAVRPYPAESWREHELAIDEDGDLAVNLLDPGEDRYSHVSRPALPALCALANAARDDADPGKLTHADLALAESEVNRWAAWESDAEHMRRQLDREFPRHPDAQRLKHTHEHATRTREAWHALAAKLAALLPPRGPEGA